MELLKVSKVISSIDVTKKHNVYKDRILFITGYLCDNYLYDSMNDYIYNTENKIEIGSCIRGGIRENILKRNNLEKAHVNIVCILTQPIRIQINHIFKIQLVYENGKVYDELKVNKASIPKEIREII